MFYFAFYLNKIRLSKLIVICREFVVVITQAKETEQYPELTDHLELFALT